MKQCRLLSYTNKLITINYQQFFLYSERKVHNFAELKDAAVRGAPPLIIFERLKLPQQIIYRRKGNLSDSPNHFKYWENILISRFYEQFSRSSRNLGHFWKFEKISNS